MSAPYEPLCRDVPLADPRTIRAWAHAQDAAWMARRVVEARRPGPLIGCTAGLLCTEVFGLKPSWPLLAYDLPFVAMAWWILRRNQTGEVQVFEPTKVYAPLRWWRVVVLSLLFPACAIGGIVFYNLVFKHLDYRVVNVLMFVSVLPFSVWCLVRFAKFLFWEDLVFAAGVPLGWAGAISGRESQTLMGGAHLAPLLIFVAVIFLFNRYRHVGPMPGNAIPSEADPA